MATMGILNSLLPPAASTEAAPNPILSKNLKQAPPRLFNPSSPSSLMLLHSFGAKTSSAIIPILVGAAGIALVSTVGPSHAAGSPVFSEPSNALSLPTWAVHVSSVVEWATAMALVWQYAEKSGYESWKGLSWGMVPLLGGALCACTWHFFYNTESLEVLVALQAALTVIGNTTMYIAAYRIYMSSQKPSDN